MRQEELLLLAFPVNEISQAPGNIFPLSSINLLKVHQSPDPIWVGSQSIGITFRPLNFFHAFRNDFPQKMCWQNCLGLGK
jgi:hypothetical protein